MAPRNRGEIQRETRMPGIDGADRRIARLAEIENARPSEVRNTVIAAINRKRMVGSNGTARNLARGEVASFFQWKEEDERVVSINLAHNVNFRTDSNPLQPTRAVALIQYGAGGGHSNIEVDVKRSCSFSLVAGFIQCSILNESPNVGDMPVAAWLSDRPVAQPIPPTRTIYHGAIGAAAAQIFGVPVAAARVRVMRAPATAPFVLTLRDIGVAGATVEVNVAANQESGLIEIPGDCSAMEIVNGAVPITAARLIFELSL